MQLSIRREYLSLVVGLVITFAPLALRAAEVPGNTSSLAVADAQELTPEDKKTETDKEKKTDDTKKSAALDAVSFDTIKSHFGASISVTLDSGTRSRIEEARLVDGPDGKKVVRVTRDHDQVARVLLESHFLLWTGRHGNDYQWGIGPFVGVQPGSDNIIEAAAFGGMIAFRSGATGRTGFSIGIGIIGDPKVKVLGDGIEENKPLPAGETEIRFKETGQGGLVILAGFVF